MTPAALLTLLRRRLKGAGRRPQVARDAPAADRYVPNRFQAAFGVSRETLDRLGTYENLLRAGRRRSTSSRRARSTTSGTGISPIAPSSGSIGRPSPNLARSRLRRRLSGPGAGDPWRAKAARSPCPRRERQPQGRIPARSGPRDRRRCGHPVHEDRKGRTRAKVGAVDWLRRALLRPAPGLLELVGAVFCVFHGRLVLEGPRGCGRSREAAQDWHLHSS